MTDFEDVELYRQAVELLEPGPTQLNGAVVHTPYDRSQEPAMNEHMLEVGERIADARGDGEVYVYAGENDDRFGAGQFHGRRLEDDEVSWECQQVFRKGSFDLVFYWEAVGAHETAVESIGEIAAAVVPITESGFLRR